MVENECLYNFGNIVSNTNSDFTAWVERVILDIPKKTFIPAAAEYIVWRQDRKIQVHCHDELFHLEWFRGRGRFTLDNRNYPMRGTTLLLIPPGRKHAFASLPNANIQNLTVKFSIKSVDFLKRLPVVYLCDWPEAFSHHIQDGLQWIFEEFQLRNLVWERIVSGSIGNLMVAILRAGLSCQDKPAPSTLDAACRYLALHYAEYIRIEEVARRCGLRADSLSRLFKTHLNTTPRSYLQTIRLRQAQALLRSGYTITEVAEQTGFSSIHYFSRVFAQKFGLPPSRWAYNNSSRS